MESLNTDKIVDAAEAARKAAIQISDKSLAVAKDQVEMMRAEAADLMKATQKAVRKNPLASIALAAGAGVLIAGVVGLALRGISRA